jgi:hypothetical protein
MAKSPNEARKKMVEIIKEATKKEYAAMLRESKEKAPDVAKKLEELRKNLIPTMTTNENVGSWGGQRMSKRVQLKSVSEIIGLPVNEIMLYCINELKNSNERTLIEWHLGHLYFFSE